MATERDRQEEIIALTFNAEQEHFHYWQERMDTFGIEDEPPQMGSPAHFDLAVMEFCRRNLPEDTPDRIFAEYMREVAGIDQGPGVMTPELFVARESTNMRDLLSFCFYIQFQKTDTSNDVQRLQNALRQLYGAPDQLSYVTALHSRDPETFWRLILTRSLPVYSQQKATGDILNIELSLLLSHEFLIEELTEDGQRPFTPEEFQNFTDNYLKRRILQNEDRLNPVVYVRRAIKNTPPDEEHS